MQHATNFNTVIAYPEDLQADAETIELLNEVDALRMRLKQKEAALSTAVVQYGKRRGYTGYREFYLRNELNAQKYKGEM